MPDARDEILAECALAFAGNSEDCNKYVKAVSGPFFDPDLFTGPGMNAAARVQRKRVSETFGAQVARDGRISYFARDVQTLPATLAVTRLVDELRGVRIPTTEMALAPVEPKRIRKAAGKPKAKKGKRGS